MAREKISDAARVDNKGDVGTALALVGGTTAAKTYNLANYEVKREVSTPTLSIKGDNIRLLVEFVSPIASKTTKKVRNGVEQDVTVYSAKVIDMTDGIEKSLVISAVFRSELETSYPNGGYVGKCFAAEKLGKKEGRDYNVWSIKEIAPKA